MKLKFWHCGNCGHDEPATESLTELAFRWYHNRICITKCRCCGSYVISQSYDESFTAGKFLVVRAHNKIRGKS